MVDKTDALKIKKEGGKSGAIVDPRAQIATYGPDAMLDVARGFGRCFADVLGSQYIAATDMGSNGAMMLAMCEGAGRLCTTGIPNKLPGQNRCTGFGGAVMGERYATYRGWKPTPGMPVVVHGIGKAGLVAAQTYSQWGYRIVGVADMYGGLVNPRGFNMDLLTSHLQRTQGRLQGFEGKEIGAAEVLELAADRLVIASTENVVTLENRANIKAPVTIAIANAPVTLNAQSQMAAAGQDYLSWQLASIFGVYGSDFELDESFTGDVLAEVSRKVEPVHDGAMRMMNVYSLDTTEEAAKALAVSNRLASMGVSL
jgi:glutamate dehydrogenase